MEIPVEIPAGEIPGKFAPATAREKNPGKRDLRDIPADIRDRRPENYHVFPAPARTMRLRLGIAFWAGIGID